MWVWGKCSHRAKREYKCGNISYLTQAVMAVCWEEPMTAVPFSGTHFSQHSHPERRTCHDVSFIPPVWHQAWICYDITLRLRVSYCLLFFISSPPVDLSLGVAVSGFVCVCLSACSSVLLHVHRKGMLLSWMHRLSRQWEEIILPSNRLSRLYLEYRDTKFTVCDGQFWGENTTISEFLPTVIYVE